jgi:hypothetical protein
MAKPRHFSFQLFGGVLDSFDGMKTCSFHLEKDRRAVRLMSGCC